MLSQVFLYISLLSASVTGAIATSQSPDGGLETASLLAPPVDVRREDHVKRTGLFGDETPPTEQVIFDDLALTKTKEHRRISRITCGYYRVWGITHLSFGYKDLHNPISAEVNSVDNTREAHGDVNSGDKSVQLVQGDVIHKVVIHKSPTRNGGTHHINYIEFWSADGDRQRKPLFTCGAPDATGECNGFFVVKLYANEH